MSHALYHMRLSNSFYSTKFSQMKIYIFTIALLELQCPVLVDSVICPPGSKCMSKAKCKQPVNVTPNPAHKMINFPGQEECSRDEVCCNATQEKETVKKTERECECVRPDWCDGGDLDSWNTLVPENASSDATNKCRMEEVCCHPDKVNPSPNSTAAATAAVFMPFCAITAARILA